MTKYNGKRKYQNNGMKNNVNVDQMTLFSFSLFESKRSKSIK